MEQAVHLYAVAAEQPCCCSPSASTGLPCPEESCTSCNMELCQESSTNSTPFVSAPSSPLWSTPFAHYLAREMLSQAHDFIKYDAASACTEAEISTPPSSPSPSEFEFSSRFSETDAWFDPSGSGVVPPMSTAEELFHNGKIRPLNTRSCSPSQCICIGDAVVDDGYRDPHFHDACHAYTDGLPSPHAEHHHHEEQDPVTRKQRSGHTNPPLSALEQWKKSMGRYENGPRRHVHRHHAERVVQIPSLPLARYRNSRHKLDGHHRRARSISPMRVFHMDDKMMQARASFESGMHTCNSKSLHAGDGASTTNMRPRRSRKTWTLKELLSMGDNRVHDKRLQLQGNGTACTKSAKSGSASAYTQRREETEASFKSAKGGVGKSSSEEERLHSKSSMPNEATGLSQNLQRGDAEEYYCCKGSEEDQAEEMKRRNFVHYKKGLMGCLGFTSKLNSVKGLQSCMP